MSETQKDGAWFFFDENTHVAVMAYIAWDMVDWMGVVMAQKDEPWKFIYRFKYYADDGPPNPKDRRSGAVVTGKDATNETRDALIKGFEMVESIMVATSPHGPIKVHDRLLIFGTGEDAMKEMASKHWAHMRTEDKP